MTRLGALAFALVAAGTLWFPSPLTAQGVSPRIKARNQVMDLLLKREPPTEDQLRKVGPDVDSLLTDIINDSTVDLVSRRRAITALGFFDNRRSRQVLSSIVTDPAWEKPYRVAALEAVAGVMGEEAFEMVKDRSNDPDEDVRAACVRALEIMGGSRARDLLKSLLLQERSPAVMKLIDKALGNINRTILEGEP